MNKYSDFLLEMVMMMGTTSSIKAIPTKQGHPILRYKMTVIPMIIAGKTEIWRMMAVRCSIIVSTLAIRLGIL